MTRIFTLAFACALAAQTPPSGSPDTYSFLATNSIFTDLNVKVNRNGPKELIESTSIANPTKFHIRVLYDFPAHRLYTVDLNSHICTTQVYSDAYAPPMYDPIGGPIEVPPGGFPPALRHETVNGIPAKVFKVQVQTVWIEDQHNFPVKMVLALPGQPARTVLEMRQLSYAPSPASLFVAPTGCQEIGGVTGANGGHAEMKVEVQGHARMKSEGGRTEVSGSAQIRPLPPHGVSRVTAVHLRQEPASYTGRCPAPVRLVAEITTDGPGTVWYSFLAGAVRKNGPAEGSVAFAAAGTTTVTLEGTVPRTPAVPSTRVLTAMEDAAGRHGPQTVRSEDVNYNFTCQ